MRTGKKFSLGSLWLLLFGVLFVFSGCMGIVGSAVISSFPTYQETVDGWPDIEAGKGRVVVYYVKQEGSGLVGPSVASLKIDDDRNLRASFSDRTFVFADLAEGAHSLELKCAVLRKCRDTGIQIKAGETLYVKVDNDKKYFQSLQLIDEDEAIEELKPLHHNFKKPLSIYYQTKPL